MHGHESSPCTEGPARVKQAVDGAFASAALDRFCYRTSYFDYLLVQIVNHNLKC